MNKFEEALFSAIRADNLDGVRLALARGCNPNALDNNRWTPLGLAATRGVLPIVRDLVASGANVNQEYSNGYIPLQAAVITGRNAVVDLLLEKGADPNAKAENGCPLLLLSAFAGNFTITMSLLKHNADVSATDSNGHTALMVAASNGHKNIATALQQAKQKSFTPIKNNENFFASVRSGDIKAVERFLDGGLSPDTTDKDKYPALVLATTKGQNGIVELLLKRGADVDLKDDSIDERNALLWASYFGFAGTVTLLLANGADVSIKDKTGNIALDYARRRKHLSIEKTLIAHTEKKQSSSVEAPQKNTSRTLQAIPTSGSRLLEKLTVELNEMVGLERVKADVTQLVNFLRVQKLRKGKGLSVPEQSLHMVFTGNPGTGKTTIARLIAQIYASMGILSQGQFVETDRAGLVGGYLGQTAIKTQEVVEGALGGVLFIDEAYSLTDSTHGHDLYGQEAVATLLKMMEDHRDDLIVIVAGYTEPMQKFIRSNPGLQSRFSKFLHFDDYAPSELTEIFGFFAAQADYKLHPATELKLHNVFADLYAARDESFGNARLARNMFEKAINAHANRMVSAGAVDEASLVTLYPEDVPIG